MDFIYFLRLSQTHFLYPIHRIFEGLLGQETTFQSTAFALVVVLSTAFDDFVVQRFGKTGHQLCAGAAQDLTSLQTFWERLLGKAPPVAQKERLSAAEENEQQMSDEADADANSETSDADAVIWTLMGLALALTGAGSGDGDGDGAAGGGDDTDFFRFIPNDVKSRQRLSVSTATNVQEIAHALTRCQDCTKRLGAHKRAAFCAAAAQYPESAATFELIPANNDMTALVDVPRCTQDVIDINRYGILPASTVAQLVAFFLADSNVLASAAVATLRLQGQCSLAVSPETVSFARAQAERRLAYMAPHEAVPYISAVAPTTLALGSYSAARLKQYFLSRILRQAGAAATADARVLQTAKTALVLLSLPLTAFTTAATCGEN